MQPSQRISVGKEVVPGYKFQKILGKGSMGKVYQATQVSMERPVAVKILSREYAAKEEYVERFFSEAKAVAKLNHPNIISGIDVGEHQGLYFFVMEFVEGTNLHKAVLKRGPLPYEEVYQITLQITQALQHAYRYNMVHRDIKPDNIMMTPDGLAKLCDLGLAKKATLGVKGKTKKTVGTPQYISPEQAMGLEDVDIRADIYSLGASVFHLLTGQPPFTEGEALDLMRQHLNNPFPDMGEFRQDVPKRFLKILDKMVAKDRNERQQTPEELLEELTALKEGPPRVSSRRAGVMGSERVLTPGAEETPWLKYILWGVGGLILVSLTMFLARKPKTSQPKIPKKMASSWPSSVQNHDSGSGLASADLASGSESGSADGSGSGSGSASHSGTSSYQVALQYQKEAQKAYNGVKNYLLFHDHQPKRCLAKLEEFLKKYPRSPFLSSAQSLVRHYQKKLQKATQTQPNLKKREEKFLAQLEIQILGLIQNRKYIQALKRLASFLQRFPLEKLKNRVKFYEEKLLEKLRGDHRALLAKTPLTIKELAQWKNFYEKLKPLGSPSFQKEIQKKLDQLEEVRLTIELEGRKKSLWIALGAYNFEKAEKEIRQLLDDPKYQTIRSKIHPLQDILNQVIRGYDWISCQLAYFQKKRIKIYLTDSKRDFFRIQEWMASSDKIIIRWYGKRKDVEEFYLQDFLPYLRRWFQKSQKEAFSKLGLFLLFSGDVKGAEELLPSQFSNLIGWIKKNTPGIYPPILVGKANRYLRHKAYGEGRDMLLTLKKSYKQTPYFKKNRGAIFTLFKTIVQSYFRERGIEALVHGKVTFPKKNFYQISYDFSKEELELWRDWKGIPVQNFSKNPEVRGGKKTMIIRGLARYPIVFSRDVEVRVKVKLSAGKNSPANLCVLMGEKGGNKPRWFLGVWFKIPGLNRIYLGPSRKGDVFWYKYPAHGIVFYQSGGPRKARGILIWNKPRLYKGGIYRARFYHIGKLIGVKLNGRSLMVKTEKRTNDQRGTFSFYTGRKTLRFYKILIRGYIDQDWLDKTLTQTAQKEFQKYKK